MNDQDLADQVRDGAQAERILNDRVYRGAVEQIEKELFAAWKSSRWDESEKREHLYLQMRALGETENRLRAVMGNGQVAKTMLQKLADKLRS